MLKNKILFNKKLKTTSDKNPTFCQEHTSILI